MHAFDPKGTCVRVLVWHHRASSPAATQLIACWFMQTVVYFYYLDLHNLCYHKYPTTKTDGQWSSVGRRQGCYFHAYFQLLTSASTSQTDQFSQLFWDSSSINNSTILGLLTQVVCCFIWISPDKVKIWQLSASFLFDNCKFRPLGEKIGCVFKRHPNPSSQWCGKICIKMDHIDSKLWYVILRFSQFSSMDRVWILKCGCDIHHLHVVECLLGHNQNINTRAWTLLWHRWTHPLTLDTDKLYDQIPHFSHKI